MPKALFCTSFRNGQRPDRLLVDGVASLLMLALVNLESSGRTVGGLPPVTLNRVLEYIEANLAYDIQLPCLATCANLSVPHFAAAFRTSTDASE